MSDAKWCPSMALTWVQAFGIPGGMQLRSLSQWLIIQTISNSTTIAAIAPPHIETPNPVLTLLSLDSSKFTSCFWRTPEFRNNYRTYTRIFYIGSICLYKFTVCVYIIVYIYNYIYTRRYYPNNPNTTPSNEESPQTLLQVAGGLLASVHLGDATTKWREPFLLETRKDPHLTFWSCNLEPSRPSRTNWLLHCSLGNSNRARRRMGPTSYALGRRASPSMMRI